MIDIDYEEERQVAAVLADRVRRGEKAAEAEIVDRYSRGLRFLLQRRTRDPEAAEDLLQETWIIALERLRTEPLADPCRLAGYLCGVARHLALNEARKAARRNTNPSSDVIELIPDDQPSPLREASRAEICKHVRNLLGELRQDRDRQILNLFYVREQDKESICRKLNVDGTHFNRVLFRARQRLRDIALKDGVHSSLQGTGP